MCCYLLSALVTLDGQAFGETNWQEWDSSCNSPTRCRGTQAGHGDVGHGILDKTMVTSMPLMHGIRRSYPGFRDHETPCVAGTVRLACCCLYRPAKCVKCEQSQTSPKQSQQVSTQRLPRLCASGSQMCKLVHPQGAHNVSRVACRVSLRREDALMHAAISCEPASCACLCRTPSPCITGQVLGTAQRWSHGASPRSWSSRRSAYPSR